MSSATRIPIIIVSYRNPTDVVDCMKALQRLAADPSFDVYLCENGGAEAFDDLISSLTGRDGPCEDSAAWNIGDEPMPRFIRLHSLRLRGRHARVLVAEAAENFGYAGAINSWLSVLLSAATWIGAWILNPDTQPEAEALAELVAWSAARGKGMVGSRVVPILVREFVHTRGLQWRPLWATTKAIDFQAPAAVEPDPEELERRLDAPSGSSIYVSRTCLESIGLMDERYFLYFEDLEWGYRAKRGCGIGYAHSSVVPHRGGTTIGSGRTRSAASPFSVYLDFRNRVLFVRQHYRNWIAWTFIMLLARSLEYGMVGAFGNMCVALAGLRAGLAGETGRPDRLFEFAEGPPRLRQKAALAHTASIRPKVGNERSTGAQFVAVAVAKRKSKIAISLGFHLIVLAGRLLRRAAGSAPRHRLIILYYHSVPAALRARFVRQLDVLAARATVVPADYLGAAVRGGHRVAITFDDALTSVLDNAIPELRARGMPATIFIPAGSLGRPPAWEMEDNSVDDGAIVATADALGSVASEVVKLGAHTLTHPHLTRLRPEDARSEIAGCRMQIKTVLGTDTRNFAFPYGDHNAAVVELCREAGYDHVYTNIPKPVDLSSDEFVRGRVLVDPTDGPLEFYLKMSGAYAWMGHVSAAKKWLKTRLRGEPQLYGQ